MQSPLISSLRTTCGLVVCLSAFTASTPAHELLNYEEHAKPIIQKSCGGADCHISQAKSGVELTTYETLMGSVGDQYKGPIVVPGDPDGSPLLAKVSSVSPKFGVPMPKDADPLTDEDVGTLRRWIVDGARRSHTALRGDANGDDILNITDPVQVLNFLFLGGLEPACKPLGDATGDGTTNLTDPVFVLNFLFLGGPAPQELTDAEFVSCRATSELSFTSIYEKVFAASCAFSSCHSSERHKGGLSLETREGAYQALVGVQPANETALAGGYLRVEPGNSDKSFLLKKLMSPGPGEGNRMPNNSPAPLSGATIGAIREWILAGAPLEGTIHGVPDITDDPPPPSDRIPQPPVPENGVQLHLGPFAVAPRSEREIFFYVDKAFGDQAEDITVQRIDVHMSDESHHFILYQWIKSTKPPAGIRETSSVDFLSSQRFIVGAQQSYLSLSFPEGVGLKFPKTASFDLNSHYLNLGRETTLQAEVYVNIFFAQPGSVTTIAKPIFDINQTINVPPHETRTTKLVFPSLTSQLQDPALGSNGRVTKETHIYALSSHMHRHGVRFSAFLVQNGRDMVPPQMVYDNLDWDDPLNRLFSPPFVLQPGQGLRFEVTHTYDDPSSDNAPPLTFGPTSEDEMAILLGFYAIK